MAREGKVGTLLYCIPGREIPVALSIRNTIQKDDGCRRKDNEPSVGGEREQKGSTVVLVLSRFIRFIRFDFAPNSSLNFLT